MIKVNMRLDIVKVTMYDGPALNRDRGGRYGIGFFIRVFIRALGGEVCVCAGLWTGVYEGGYAGVYATACARVSTGDCDGSDS